MISTPGKVARFGFTGIGIGAVSLLLALVHFWAGPFSPQQPLEETIAEKAVAIRDATVAAMKGEEFESQPQAKRIDLDQAINIAIAVLGGIAIILGVIGFATGERKRAAFGAIFLGGAAIGYQFLTVALVAIIFAILVAAVLSQLGLG